MNCWDVVGNAANILGIISFPFAIYELIAIKSRIKKAQESMNELLILKDYQTISELTNMCSKMQEDLSRIIGNHSKKGVTKESIKGQCQAIIDELDKCIVDTPSQHDDLTTLFINCKREIQNYVEKSNLDHLKDAQDYLYSCISSLKRLSASTLSAEAERIAQSK